MKYMNDGNSLLLCNTSTLACLNNQYLQSAASVDYSFCTIYHGSDRCIEIPTDLIVDGLRLECISIYCHFKMLSVPCILICTGLQKWNSHFQGCEQCHVFVNAHHSKSVKKVSYLSLVHLLFTLFMISWRLDC